MTLASADNTEAPYVKKTVSAAISSIFGTTAQFLFFQAGDFGSADYVFLFTNQGNTEQLYIQVEAGGTLTIEVGPTNAQNFYSGAWSSKPGVLRKFSITVDALGVPRLFIDGEETPLILFSNSGGRAGFQGNSVFALFNNDIVTPLSFVVKKIFLATGVKPNVDFCCP